MENISLQKIIGVIAIVIITIFVTRQGSNDLNLGSDNEAVFGSIASSSVSAISTTATSILSRNSGRIYAYCVNNGGATVFLGLGGNASKQWGIALQASESYEFTKDKNLFLGPVYGITHSGTSRVSCVERTN